MDSPFDKMVQGTLNFIQRDNHRTPPATQSEYAQALLQKIPGQVMPLSSPFASIFGDRYTYHRYSDPKDQAKIKDFETSIGSLKNTMPLMAGGGFLAGQLLSPVRRLLKGFPGAFLLNPLILAGGAGALSAFLTMQKKEQMTDFLSDRMKNIQSGSGDFERDLSAMSMSTTNQQTGLRQGYNELDHTQIKNMLERMDDIARDKGGKISNVPARMYSLQDGTHLYAKTPDAHLYDNVTLPDNADDDNITLEQMTYVRNDGKMNGRLVRAPEDAKRRKALFMRQIIQKTGLRATDSASDASFIARNKKTYSHALNLFKAKHSAVNTVLESVKKDIRNAAKSVRQELTRRPFSMGAMRSHYINSVIFKIKNDVSSDFSAHPDMLDIVDSLLFKEWRDIVSEYKNRTY